MSASLAFEMFRTSFIMYMFSRWVLVTDSLMNALNANVPLACIIKNMFLVFLVMIAVATYALFLFRLLQFRP